MHCKKPLSIAITCVMFMLAGCDKTVETVGYRLNITPSLGKIQNADVFVYSANGGALLGKGKTREWGVLGMRPKNTEDPIYISVQSSGSTVYFDEELGETTLGLVSLPASSPMRAIAPNVLGSYGVTPLTELAYRVAEDQGLFPLTRNEINILNGAIQKALAPELASILVEPTIIDTETEFCQAPVTYVADKKICKGKEVDDLLMADTQANRYALRIAALVKLGAGRSAPALDMMSALGNDIIDGKIDGLDKNGSAINTPYNPATFKNDFAVAMKAVAKNYANKAFEDVVKTNLTTGDSPWNIQKTILTDPSIVDDGSYYSGCRKLADGELPALPPAIASKTVDMIFSGVDFNAPFKDKETVRLTFCNDGQMRITDQYYIVANSFTPPAPGSVETTYKWAQPGNGLLYELVIADGAIYEVNLYGNNGAYYYGQFQRPAAPVRDNCLKILGISLICFK